MYVREYLIPLTDISTDICGHISSIDGFKLVFIADGNSSRKDSKLMVQAFKQYMEHIDLSLLVDEPDFLFNWIKQQFDSFQQSIRYDMPNAGMSFLVVIITPAFLHVFYSGDCRLGELHTEHVEWLTEPHLILCCETNELVNSHIVFKCFKAKRFESRDLSYHKVDLAKVKYILATDGFWRLTKEDQIKVLSNDSVTNLMDDITAITFQI